MPQWQQFPLMTASPVKTTLSSSHPPIHSLFFPPLNLSPLSQFPSSPPMCTYSYVLYGYVSFHAYLRVWVPLCANTCLFDISFPLSAALKAHVCLFSVKPRRERCVGAHRLARPGTTPHRNVWNYTQQGLAHPCLLSLALPVCHSFTAWA